MNGANNGAVDLFIHVAHALVTGEAQQSYFDPLPKNLPTQFTSSLSSENVFEGYVVSHPLNGIMAQVSYAF